MSKRSTDMSWKEAIIVALGSYPDGIHYSVIAEDIVKLGLRKKVGATPANTVNATINSDINDNQELSTFVKTEKGCFALREGTISMAKYSRSQKSDDGSQIEGESVIKSFGMFWLRTSVDWRSSSPRIYGSAQQGADRVDFSEQSGIYLLYDGREVVYVGRTKDRLGSRLREHTVDRLASRWDRFSWFGFSGVSESGELTPSTRVTYTSEQVIAVLEAVLIEGLEPRQNRRLGDGYSGTEFNQVVDPDLEDERQMKILEDVLRRAKKKR